MKSVLGILAIMTVLAISIPSEAFIDVCWRDVTIAVRKSGKVSCRKCTAKKTNDLEETNCKRFIQEREAREWMRQNCDCR